ncbi:MAG TPA: alpha/beta fold hydrolase [Roseiflexaceae bacterium]|nr:alpha/beta fold hydrolase [Roseiflexaceae bacterium]
MTTSTRLLFLPGAGGDPRFWHPLGGLLPGTREHTFLAWPGLGEQPPSADVRGFDDLVRLVEERMGDGPVDLLAQSMGGPVALQVALRNPGRVHRLVLAATSGGVDVSGLGGADWRPDYRRQFPRAAAWITDARPELTDLLPSIIQPTLLLWGDADPISPLAVGQRLQQLLPHATLVVVPGGDHAMVHDRPHDIAEVIVRHLQ